MKTYIYYLEREGIPFYIGKTNKPSNRQNSHRAKRKDFNIYLHTIDLVDSNDWKYWETFYIDLFKSWGFVLENKNNGGGGTNTQSMSTKLLKSHKLKGKSKPPRTKEHCLKLSQSTKGHPVSEITKNKISKAKKGKSSPLKGRERIYKGRISPNQGKGKPIYQCDLEGNIIQEHQNILSACLYIGKPNRNGGISDCLRGKSKSAYGFFWKYKYK